MTFGNTVKADKKHCPFLDRECLQDKCMLWSEFEKEDKTRYFHCAVAFLPILQSQQIVEQIRTQGAVEKFRNIVVDGGRALMQIGVSKREIGNVER